MTSVEVKVDDAELNAAFGLLIQHLGDLRPVMASIGEYMIRGTDDRFRDQRSPDGAAWAPLAASTLARKKNSKILTETGRLRGSVTYQATATSVVVGTNVQYARYHQFGTAPYIIRPRQKKALYWPGAAHPVKQANHPGLRSRPFLGVSPQDSQEILGIIQDFLT